MCNNINTLFPPSMLSSQSANIQRWVWLVKTIRIHVGMPEKNHFSICSERTNRGSFFNVIDIINKSIAHIMTFSCFHIEYKLVSIACYRIVVSRKNKSTTARNGM